MKSRSTHPAVLVEEFIYDTNDAPTPQCHASTIAAATSGELVAAWFGGTEEKNNDVGIWLSRYEAEGWTEPVEVANGVQSDEKRFPCWNPVLFQPKSGPLMLFYKVGPDPEEWWGMMMVSRDAGKTWSKPDQLPDGIYGPIKNKPVQLASGELLCPSSTENDGWKVHIEITEDMGLSWVIAGPINDGKTFGAIQPTILTYNDNKMQILCRSEQGVITESWSDDAGRHWSPMTATTLLNPNSGIDAVSLVDGRQLLVYNPTDGEWGPRVPLSIATSQDGETWTRVLDLEPVTDSTTVNVEEYSYPGVIQSKDGMVHIVYTYNRETVKHVKIDPAKL